MNWALTRRMLSLLSRPCLGQHSVNVLWVPAITSFWTPGEGGILGSMEDWQKGGWQGMWPKNKGFQKRRQGGALSRQEADWTVRTQPGPCAEAQHPHQAEIRVPGCRNPKCLGASGDRCPVSKAWSLSCLELRLVCCQGVKGTKGSFRVRESEMLSPCLHL